MQRRRIEYRDGATQYLEWLQDYSGYDNVISCGNGQVYRESGSSLFAHFNTARIGDRRFGTALRYTRGGPDMDANVQLEDSATHYFPTALI
ncbi:MAG: hypothetical protein SGI99_18415 [Pseudomonadota bacterium]|nr:hypothetical protein [Pseudomonadota bacterium]